MRRDSAEAIAMAGGSPAVELVTEQEQALLKADVRISELETKIQELEARLNQDSSNSSKPPSSDPPLNRAQRRAMRKERRKPSPRNPGGQPGHEGHHRPMVPIERVDEVVDHLPGECHGCGERFSGSEKTVGTPVVSQQWDIPKIEPHITEHRLWRKLCPNCGKDQLAEAPGPLTLAFGPNITAHTATLAGEDRLSRRQIATVTEEMFSIPISTGSVDALLMRVSNLLDKPYGEIRERALSSEVVHVDETSWPLKGEQQWLWALSSATDATFRIDRSRSQRAAKELLGSDFDKVAVTDRYGAYNWIDNSQRQLCWAHLLRQFASLSERQGPPGRLGKRLVRATDKVFDSYHQFSDSEDTDLKQLTSSLSETKKHIHQLLTQGTRQRHKRTATFCNRLLYEWNSLWQFCEKEGIPLTNNQAERGLRHPVIMRKVSLGTQSHRGNRWVERILSVRETCRLQQRSVLEYLREVTTAAYANRPVPTLVPP